MTHTLSLLCKFSRADDAVYPSSFKAACFGLSVPNKLAVVLFSRHSFHKVKTDSDRYAGMTSSCPVYGLENNIKPHYFVGIFDRTMVSGCQMLAVAGLSKALGVEPSQAEP